MYIFFRLLFTIVSTYIFRKVNKIKPNYYGFSSYTNYFIEDKTLIWLAKLMKWIKNLVASIKKGYITIRTYCKSVNQLIV